MKLNEKLRVPRSFFIIWVFCMIIAIGFIVMSIGIWGYNEYFSSDNRSYVREISGKLIKDLSFFDIENKDKYVIQLGIKEEFSKYAADFSNKKKDRKTKYENSSNNTKIIVWSWQGGNSVKKEQLEQTINAVLSRLDHIPHDKNLVALLMETAAVESHRGKYMTQLNDGPARGIYQMEYNTIIDTLAWLKKSYNDVYRSVQSFYNKNESELWNYCYNVPWQTAMAITYYWRFGGTDIVNLCETRYDRALLYKLIWNTKNGKTTLDKYFRDTETYA